MTSIRFIVVIGLVGLLGVAPRAEAGTTFAIEFTGIDWSYDGFTVFDSGDLEGGNGEIGEATPLSAVTFSRNGDPVGTLTTDLFADVFIDGVFDIPSAGGTVVNPVGGGFDLLDGNSTPEQILAIDVFPEFTVTYDEANGVITGASTIESDAVFFQDLPFDFEIDDRRPVTISLAVQLESFTDDGQFLTSFSGTGTGSIQGVLVPEPTPLVTLGAGTILVVAWRRIARS